MDYEEAWKETVKWVDGGIHYMDMQMEIHRSPGSHETIEYKRILSKREGLEVVRQFMNNTEKIYKG